MNGNEKDWWDSSPEEDEWVWIGGDNEEDTSDDITIISVIEVNYDE